jgi:hypothetical protein
MSQPFTQHDAFPSSRLSNKRKHGEFDEAQDSEVPLLKRIRNTLAAYFMPRSAATIAPPTTIARNPSYGSLTAPNLPEKVSNASLQEWVQEKDTELTIT